MAKILKMIRRTVLTISTIFVLWLIGLLAQFPVIPLIETNYVSIGTNEVLSKGVELRQTDNLIIKLVIPEYFPEKDQCFDTWFSSKSGQHTLTVSDFSIAVFNKNNLEIKKLNSYPFWENGSKEETLIIENHRIAKFDTIANDQYVFFRSVYNVDDGKEFKILIKADFILDSVKSNIEKSIVIAKRQKLTWTKLRAH